jgi:hypothetical protein
MWRGLVITSLIAGTLGCGGLSKEEAKKQVDQLVVLYQENRPKFVEQKQAIEQASSCGRATALREAVDDKVHEQAMSPEKNETLTLVQMELQQAEKTCRAK